MSHFILKMYVLHNNFIFEFFISNFYMTGIQVLNLRVEGNPHCRVVGNTSLFTLVACLLLFALANTCLAQYYNSLTMNAQHI